MSVKMRVGLGSWYGSGRWNRRVPREDTKGEEREVPEVSDTVETALRVMAVARDGSQPFTTLLPVGISLLSFWVFFFRLRSMTLSSRLPLMASNLLSKAIFFCSPFFK